MGWPSHDFQGKTTYNGTTGAGQTTHHSTMAPRLRSRWVDRPSSHTLAGNVTSTTLHERTSSTGTTDDDGQDGVCAPGPRQTAVDDTHVATGRQRGVDALS